MRAGWGYLITQHRHRSRGPRPSVDRSSCRTTLACAVIPFRMTQPFAEGETGRGTGFRQLPIKRARLDLEQHHPFLSPLPFPLYSPSTLELAAATPSPPPACSMLGPRCPSTLACPFRSPVAVPPRRRARSGPPSNLGPRTRRAHLERFVSHSLFCLRSSLRRGNKRARNRYVLSVFITLVAVR